MPPAGLNYIEINAEDFDLDENMMDSRSSLLDLAGAPPLLNESEMEITTSGEKRKATPPDLLTLSHMYFEKNQVHTHKDKSNGILALFRCKMDFLKLKFKDDPVRVQRHTVPHFKDLE